MIYERVFIKIYDFWIFFGLIIIFLWFLGEFLNISDRMFCGRLGVCV